MTGSFRVAIKPWSALSKSLVSSKGNSSNICWCVASTDCEVIVVVDCSELQESKKPQISSTLVL